MPVIGPCRVVKSFYKGALRLSVLCKISDRKNIAQKFRLHFLKNHDKSKKAKRNYKKASGAIALRHRAFVMVQALFSKKETCVPFPSKRKNLPNKADC